MGKVPTTGMRQSGTRTAPDAGHRESALTVGSHSETPTQPPQALDEADTRRSSAVLLVARDLSIDEPCRYALADAGVDCVFTASSSEHALQLLQRADLFDAVVIGAGTGDDAAAELAETLRRDHSETATVVVSQVENGKLRGATLQVQSDSDGVAHADSRSLRRAFSRAIAATRRKRRG